MMRIIRCSPFELRGQLSRNGNSRSVMGKFRTACQQAVRLPVRLSRGMISLALAVPLCGAAFAQADGKLGLELSALQPSDKGCRLTFLVKNDTGAEISRAAFEIALFATDGIVDRLTVLEFKGLPVGRSKVSRFELAGVDCSKVGRVLINAVTACEGAGLTPQLCETKLAPTSKTGITFGL